ncbi:hypothetical protein D3C77_550670 [compost metagenome]
MNIGDLSTQDGDKQQTNETHCQLIEQGQRRRRLGQPRSTHHYSGCPPGQACQHTKRVAQEHPAVHVRQRNTTGEGIGDAGKGQDNAQPLQRSQPFTGQQQVQAQGGKDWRGIKKH